MNVLKDEWERFVGLHMPMATAQERKLAKRAFFFGANKVLGTVYGCRKMSGNQAVMTLEKMNAEVEAFVREELGGQTTKGGLIV